MDLPHGKVDAVRIVVSNSPIFPSADHNVITMLSVRINARALRFVENKAPKLSPKVIGRDHVCIRLTRWREGLVKLELVRACVSDDKMRRLYDRSEARLSVPIGIEFYEDRWKKYPARCGTAECDSYGNIAEFV